MLGYGQNDYSIWRNTTGRQFSDANKALRALRDFVEGENEPAFAFRGYGSKAIDLLGEPGFLVLESAFGAALAFHGEAGFRHLIAYGRGVPKGNQQEQHVVLVEYVFAEDFYAVVLGSDMVEFLFH